MRINIVEAILILGALGLIGVLLATGPTRVSDKPTAIHIRGGKPIAKKTDFAAQRNYFHYKVQSEQIPLPHSAVVQLAKRFVMSPDNLYNANSQRGKQSLDTDSQRRIRIPL